MIFNSIEFLLFAVLFFLIWPFARKKNLSRWCFITISSLFFYGWWDWRFLFLIIGSGVIDYIAGALIYKRPRYGKILLISSLIANLGALSIFKYSKFFATVFQDLLALFSIEIDLISRIPEFALILPVGISFYTFQSLSYTIDIYKKRLVPTRNILHFLSYLTMFPQLVAGPIVRAKDFLFQLNFYRVPSAIEKWHAVKLICFGLFQKMVIADNLGYFVDAAFEGKSDFDGSLYWWVVMIGFSFQIYADFSGYTSIARGLAKYMGYHFKMNFNHPYLSKSLKQFWSRWHISLSTWFRDYIYIPMGGSKRGVYYSVIALTTTMVLSGLWHGANYTFIVWALLHSLWLLIERVFRNKKRKKSKSSLLIVIVFIQVLIAWVYFRSNNLRQANTIVLELLTFKWSDMSFILKYFDNLVFLLLAIFIEYLVFIRKKYLSMSILYKRSNLDVVFVALAIVGIAFFRGEGAQFIYFQF